MSPIVPVAAISALLICVMNAGFLVRQYLQQGLVSRDYTWIGNDYPATLPVPGGDLPLVELTVEESVHYGITHRDEEWATLIPVNEGYTQLGPDDRIFIVTMAHELHCLRMLNLGFSREDVDEKHLTHCLNYLQHGVLCVADLTLEPGDFVTRDFEMDSIGQTHMCRDWEVVYDVLQRTFDRRAGGAAHVVSFIVTEWRWYFNRIHFSEAELDQSKCKRRRHYGLPKSLLNLSAVVVNMLKQCTWALISALAISSTVLIGVSIVLDGRGQHTYTFVGKDFPRTWNVKREKVHKAYEETMHYNHLTPMGLAEWNTTFPSGGGILHLGEEGRPFSVSMFHQLRCLDILGREMALRRQTKAYKVPPTTVSQHCSNYLRQMVLCRANTRIEPMYNIEPPIRLVTDEVTHVCNDWSAVYAAAEQNALAHATRVRRK